MEYKTKSLIIIELNSKNTSGLNDVFRKIMDVEGVKSITLSQVGINFRFEIEVQDSNYAIYGDRISKALTGKATTAGYTGKTLGQIPFKERVSFIGAKVTIKGRKLDGYTGTIISLDTDAAWIETDDYYETSQKKSSNRAKILLQEILL
jgi:hypothetical protein